MTGENHPDHDRFTREWRNWLQRPARRSAADAAAQISAVLATGRGRRSLWLIPATAGVALGIALLLVMLPGRPPGTNSPQAAAVRSVPSPGSGEVLIWLDEHTPLYMTFQPPAPRTGSGDNR